MHGRAKDANRFKDWQEARELHRRIVRDWFRELSAIQRLALLFVYDRTVGWGKEWERITMDQCAEGIFGEDGTCYASPFTTCRKRAAKAIRELVDLGMVITQSKGADKALRYAINTDYGNEEIEMKLPKRLKDGGGNAPLMGAETPHTMGAETPRVRDTYGIKRRETKIEPAAFATRKRKSTEEERRELETMTLQIRKRSQSRSAAKKSEGRFLRKDGSGFLPLKPRVALHWRELWISNFPDTPLDPLSRISEKVLWQYWKAWTESRSSGEFADYLGWLFENWNAIRVGTFGWMGGFPKAPAIRMITSVKLRGLFEEAYREKGAIALWRKMEPHERKLRQLVEGGMDPDKAREVVEKEFASKKELAELRRSRERMAVMIETFNRRQTAAAKNAATSAGFRKRGPLPKNTTFGEWRDEE